MKPLADCRLYTFIDLAYTAGRPLTEIARQLCEGGSDLIQLRAKDWTPDQVRAAGETLLPILEAANVGLVINDHVAVAQALGAPWCHLGQEDFFDAGHRHVDEVRGGGARLRIGLSTHAPEQAERAVRAGADYIAIGPVYATGTKPGARPVTLDYVRWAASNVRVPWFAIGGINPARLEEVLAAGARRVCVVSAILQSNDVAHACREIKKRLESAARIEQ